MQTKRRDSDRSRDGRDRKERQIRLNVSQDELDRIEALEQLVDADSKTAAIRDALRLLEYVKVQERAGWSFLERDPAGVTADLELPEAPTSARTEPKTPFKIYATEAAVERMEALRRLVGATTRADLIRRALAAYEHIARRQRDGWSFSTLSDEGEAKDLVFLHLPTPATAEPLD